MKYLFIFLFSIFSYSVNAQSGKDLPDKKVDNTPQNNSSNRDKSLPVTTNLSLVENKTNPNAWMHYYIATERNKDVSPQLRKQILASTFQTSGQYIAGTWQYSLLQFLQSGKKDAAAIAFAVASGEAEIVYPYAVQYAIITGNSAELYKYTAVLKDINPLTPAVYQYHYNTLMSAGKNAVIYAKGLYDLVPLAIVQQQYKIRPDIKLRYYDNKIPEEENAYICLSSGKETIKQYPDAAYTGLLIRLNAVNKIQELETNYNAFDLSNLREGSSLTAAEAQMYKNYLPSFILLHRFYQKNKNTAADELYGIILKIAEYAGIKDTVKKLLVP
jgi:hypothetical protein